MCVCVCACTDKHTTYSTLHFNNMFVITIQCDVTVKPNLCRRTEYWSPLFLFMESFDAEGIFFPELLNNRKQSDFEFVSEYAARQLRVEANQLQFP